MNNDDIKTAIKDIEKSLVANQINTCLDILKQLQKDIKPTASLIRETGVGLAVGKLRTHENAQLAELAKVVVKQWRKEIASQKTTGGNSPDVQNGVDQSKKPSDSTNLPTNSKPTVDTTKAAQANDEKDSRKDSESPKSQMPMRSAKLDGVDTNVNRDAKRDKCLTLIYDALSMDSTNPSELILKRSISIENAVFAEFKSQSGPYLSKMRELYMNLKAKNNPGLREAVVSGEIAHMTLIKMSPQDMASEERKAADRKIQTENLFKARGAAPPKAETDAFKCGRCGQRKCTYYQMQTRSADEPMTTFVTCTVCGNRWKFC